MFFSGFFIFAYVTSAFRGGRDWLGSADTSAPHLCWCAHSRWGWQGITKQLLSDKLNQGNRKQDVQKKSHWDTLAMLWTNCLCWDYWERGEKNLEPTLEQSCEVHHESEAHSKGLGLSRFGGGLGEECYTFYGDWLTGNSPSWKQRFRARILNMFWEGSHSWNWFGRQMASRNASQTYIARWRSLIVSVPFTATW